ncbi:MAG: transposase family protein [Nostoc sp.]|uniref:transposase family protein n=1 Tax=Nostoc sp. TaxID=1180 RepID=UPI002FFCE9D2
MAKVESMIFVYLKTVDFRIFKNSKLRLREDIECLGDKGYQGIQKLHSNSRILKKKPIGGKLTYEDKKSNQELAEIRVLGEHVLLLLKVFKILSLTYSPHSAPRTVTKEMVRNFGASF